MSDKLISENVLQRPNIFVRYSPFYSSIKNEISLIFNEILEYLSLTIVNDELEPGLRIWSNKLKEFLSLYGFSFTKNDHLKLIDYYLSILSIENLNYFYVQICFDLLHQLLRRTQLLTRDDLTIDWQIFYRYAQSIFGYEDKHCRITILPEGIRGSLDHCVESCSPYFDRNATKEILDELRPQMCPMNSNFSTIMKLFELFLPVILPAEFHHQGFQLWLNEFFTIWQSLYNKCPWELFLLMKFSSLAWNNIGYIDWEPWFPQIFTRLLRGFSLPIGKMQISTQDYDYFVDVSSKWIVSMIENENSCLKYLEDLLISMKSFYHPSNTDNFQENLIDFLVSLSKHFLDRIHIEQRTRPFWYSSPRETSKLNENQITKFVHCIKDYVFISIYNKDFCEQAAEACQYLSILRPQLIIPIIIEKYFQSIENLTEPHRFISGMTCLKYISRQMVEQTSLYSEGQLYVIPILESVLPGIDLNDFDKTSATLDFLEIILYQITFIDCSSQISLRDDLTEIEKEVCLSTSKFEDIVIEFFNRIFSFVDNLSLNLSDSMIINKDLDINDLTIEAKLTTIIYNLVQNCSEEIFQIIREKIVDLTLNRYYSSNVRDIVTSLIESLVRAKPKETLKCFFPKLRQSIEEILEKNSETENVQLTWFLSIFAKLVNCQGNLLIVYQNEIFSIFDQCLTIENKSSYEILSIASKCLLQSLTQLYPIEYRLTNLNNQLPIRSWGKSIDFDKLDVEYHIPNDDEIDFACQFIDKYLYSQLIYLKEKFLNLSNNQRLKSLSLIQSIAQGACRLISLIPSPHISNLTQTVVPFQSKYQIQYSLFFKELKLKENLRLKLFDDIGYLLDQLIANDSDDVSSIIQSLDFYFYISIYNGLHPTSVKYWSLDLLAREKLCLNKLNNKGQSIRSLAIERMAVQIQQIESSQKRPLTEIDKQILIKLFQFSISRYAQVREQAQMELLNILNHFEYSFEILLDSIIELLEKSNEINHDQLKGCLYVLLGDETYFLPTKFSWSMRDKLWPLIVSIDSTKLSTQNLIEHLGEKIHDQFFTNSILQSTNDLSKEKAMNLSNQYQIKSSNNRNDIRSYLNLIEKLTSLMNNDLLTWGQQTLIISFLSLLLQKQIPIPLSTIEIFLKSLLHQNSQIRKYAEKGLAAICHLQKPPKIYSDKTISITNDENLSPGDRDDNRWITIDSYQLPKNQIEWEETCFFDKISFGYYVWPKTIRFPLNKRERFTLENLTEQTKIIYEYFNNKHYLDQMIDLIISEDQDNDDLTFNRIRFSLFKGLFRNFGLLFFENFFEKFSLLINEKTEEKQLISHRIASEIFAGIIRASKYWSLDMLKYLWEKINPLLNELYWNLNNQTIDYWSESFKYIMENIDPRRMFYLIEHFRQLINNKQIVNLTNEFTRWTLIRRLNHFQWRIPSIWCEIEKHALSYLDHSSDELTFKISIVLSMSMSFDMKLFNGQAQRHPNADVFFDYLSSKLENFMEIYQQTTLMNISDENLEMNDEARQAMNFIQTVIQITISFFYWNQQPIKHSLIRLFPYLCELESITTNNETFKDNLTISRLFLADSYFHEEYLEDILEQLFKVCSSSKWHSRRSAIEFIQNLTFSNLFNARRYSNEFHQLVLKCLFDEQIEVRTVSSITLSGLYQCAFFRVTSEDLEYFRRMSQTKYFTKINNEKIISQQDLIRRHAGVLGLCSIVLSSPYEMPNYLPDVLMLLSEHSYDPDLIQKSIRNCLSEFRRTHHDSWNEHKQQFTDDQLAILADILVSHNYYV